MLYYFQVTTGIIPRYSLAGLVMTTAVFWRLLWNQTLGDGWPASSEVD